MIDKLIQVLDLFFQENRGQVLTQWNYGFLKIAIDSTKNEILKEIEALLNQKDGVIKGLQDRIKELEGVKTNG